MPDGRAESEIRLAPSLTLRNGVFIKKMAGTTRLAGAIFSKILTMVIVGNYAQIPILFTGGKFERNARKHFFQTKNRCRSVTDLNCIGEYEIRLAVPPLRFGMEENMKKIFVAALASAMALSLAACGGKTDTGNAAQQTAPKETAESKEAEAPAKEEPPVSQEPVEGSNSEAAPEAPDQSDAEAAPKAPDQSPSGSIAPAVGGTLTLGKGDVAVVVNGTSVPMPYSLKELEAAGVPADGDRDGTTLNAGDYFSANLNLDENGDYVLIPAYYNGESSSVSIMDAQATDITMTTYADEPKDQGVSILGVSFGMPRSEVKTLLGEPADDSGDYLEWHIEVPDMTYEGTLSMYFTEDSDSAGVSQTNLTVFPK